MNLAACSLSAASQQHALSAGISRQLAPGTRQPVKGRRQLLATAAHGNAVPDSLKRSRARGQTGCLLAALHRQTLRRLQRAGTRLQQAAKDGSQRAAALLVQWDESKNLVSPSGKPWWTDTCLACGRTHSWQTTLDKRLVQGTAEHVSLRLTSKTDEQPWRAGTDCPYCAARPSPCFCRSLAATHAELAAEMSTSSGNRALKPSEIAPGSHRPVWWTCRACQHQWLATPQSRTRGRRPTGCPECAKTTSAPQQSEHAFWAAPARCAHCQQDAVRRAPQPGRGQTRAGGAVAPDSQRRADTRPGHSRLAKASVVALPVPKPQSWLYCRLRSSACLAGYATEQSTGGQLPYVRWTHAVRVQQPGSQISRAGLELGQRRQWGAAAGGLAAWEQQAGGLAL